MQNNAPQVALGMLHILFFPPLYTHMEVHTSPQNKVTPEREFMDSDQDVWWSAGWQTLKIMGQQMIFDLWETITLTENQIKT